MPNKKERHEIPWTLGDERGLVEKADDLHALKTTNVMGHIESTRTLKARHCRNHQAAQNKQHRRHTQATQPHGSTENCLEAKKDKARGEGRNTVNCPQQECSKGTRTSKDKHESDYTATTTFKHRSMMLRQNADTDKEKALTFT